MALLFADSFDTLEAIAPTYSTPIYGFLATNIVRGGTGKSIRLAYSSSLTLGAAHFSPANEIYVGFAIYYDTTNLNPAVGGSLVHFKGNGNGAQFILKTDVASLSIYDGNSQKIATAKNASVYTWNFIEVKVKVSDSSSAGDVKVRVNGEEVYSCDAGEDFNAVTNTTTDVHSVLIGSGPTGGTTSYSYIDDVYLCDSSGSANNTFLGDCKCEVLYPNANGNSSQFMGSDGNQVDNYLLVDDDGGHTGDTDYVYDDTVDQIDLYAFDNLTASISSIKGVIVDAVLRKDDAGSRTARAMIRQSSTNYEGAELFPSTDYQHFRTLWETDPNTSSAWTETGVNSAEFGLTIES